MANLYLVTCKGKDEDGPAGAYLVLANAAHVATGLGAKAYATQVADAHDVTAQELIGGDARVVSLDLALAQAGLALAVSGESEVA